MYNILYKKVAVHICIIHIGYCIFEWILTENSTKNPYMQKFIYVKSIGIRSKMKKKHKFIIRLISWILFIIYLVMMVYFLFFSEMLGRTPSDTYHYNLKPFTEIQRYITYYRRLGSFYVLLNIVGNVLCFMPLGFVLPVLSYKNRSIFKVTFMCVLCSVTVELIQLISKLGSCDVDDVILNTSGGILGYICFAICMFIFRHRTGKNNKKKNRRK